MQKQNCISISVTAAILLALTVCGSIWDLEIANAIYIGQMPGENMFGILFSYLGIIPTFVGWSFLGASIFYLSQKQTGDTRKRRRLKAFAIFLFVLSFFYVCNTFYISNANAFKVHFAVAYTLGILVICSAAHLGYKLSQRSEDPELLNQVLFLAAVSLVTVLLVSCAKEIMCRPRFRFVLATDNTDYFLNWWQNGKAIKTSLAADMVTDEFASFPSGHSAYAMFAIFLFPAFGDYICELRKYKPYLMVLGFLWWAVTALSRLTVGAHYLTDVTVAGLAAILAHIVVSTAKGIYIKGKAMEKAQHQE